MADNYTQFSDVVGNLTAEEAAWWEEQLKQISVINGKEVPLENPDDPRLFTGETYRGYRLWFNPDKTPTIDVDDPSYLGFESELMDDADADGSGRHLWIYAEVSGEPELVGLAVQKFLKKFRPDQCWSLTYSASCSKPRVGEFGGGAVFVTADDIKWENAYDFIAAREREFKSPGRAHSKE